MKGRIRLTGGSARGRVLPGAIADGVRPTSAKVREAWFSMVGHDLRDVRFLDAFAGSGVMALEAWSRGATVTAVERNRRAFTDSKRRGEALGADVEWVFGDVGKVLGDRGPFDIVFADPPYRETPERWLPGLVERCIGAVWYESARACAMPGQVGDWRLRRSKSFGDTALHEYRR